MPTFDTETYLNNINAERERLYPIKARFSKEFFKKEDMVLITTGNNCLRVVALNQTTLDQIPDTYEGIRVEKAVGERPEFLEDDSATEAH